MSSSGKTCCLWPTKWNDQNAPLRNIHNQLGYPMYYQPSWLHLNLRTSYPWPDHHPDIILLIQGATHKFNIHVEHPHTKILDFDDQSDNSKRTINPSHDGIDSILHLHVPTDQAQAPKTQSCWPMWRISLIVNQSTRTWLRQFIHRCSRLRALVT